MAAERFADRRGPGRHRVPEAERESLMRSRRRVPSHRLHKPSGEAVVTLSGRDHYLGPHGTHISKDACDRAVDEWLANGRRAVLGEEERLALVVTEPVGAYGRHAQAYYVKDGRPRGGPEIIVSRRMRPKFCSTIRRPPETMIRPGHREAATGGERSKPGRE